MNTTALRLLALILLAPLTLAAAAADAAPLKVVLFSGSAEYKSDESLAKLKSLLESKYRATCTLHLVNDKGTQLTGADTLDAADVAVFYTRRVKLADDQLDKVRKFLAAGKGVVGIRTASHGFQTWLAFDPEILGGSYANHYKIDEPADVTIDDKAKSHPILENVRPFATTGKLYKNPTLAPDVTVLLRAKSASGNAEPVAWTREPKPNVHGRVFYTSLGTPKDFEDPTFQQLLFNAIGWASGKPLAKK